MANDKPVVHFTIGQIRKDSTKVDPLTVGLSDSRTITFPDLMALETEESERKLELIESRSTRTWKALAEWLSKEDCDALRAEKLSRADLTRVLNSASRYYKDAYGDLGNANASESY